jgi:myosin tail region-interacting protein MTI1
MPVPQGPRRAAPPRKKSSQKQTPPAEAEVIASSPEKGTAVHDSSYTPSESQSAPVPLPDDVEPEVRATDPDADDVHLSDFADKNLELAEQAPSVTVPPILSPEEEPAPAPLRPASLPLEPQSASLDDPDVGPNPTQAPDEIAEPTVPLISTSQVTQEETGFEGVAIPHASYDEALVAAEEEVVEDDTDRGQGITEHVAKIGEEPGVVVVESHPAASAASSESFSYGVFQQGGGETAVEEEDDGNDGKY